MPLVVSSCTLPASQERRPLSIALFWNAADVVLLECKRLEAPEIAAPSPLVRYACTL
jgi:hypothetical protein